MVYYDAESKKSVYISGRERAPKNVQKDMYVNHQGCFGNAVGYTCISLKISVITFNISMYLINPISSQRILDAKYIAIPGEIKAYWTLHRKYGRLPWKNLVKPAVHFARNGFHISNSVAKAIKYLKDNLQINVKDFPSLW